MTEYLSIKQGLRAGSVCLETVYLLLPLDGHAGTYLMDVSTSRGHPDGRNTSGEARRAAPG